MFKGHRFIKIDEGNWVIDLTVYVGYKVTLNENKEVVSYTKAFEVTYINGTVEFNKFISIPYKILNATSDIIKKHEEKVGG